jgi:hypothetical protein
LGLPWIERWLNVDLLSETEEFGGFALRLGKEALPFVPAIIGFGTDHAQAKASQ